jgi:hypothetical protein
MTSVPTPTPGGRISPNAGNLIVGKGYVLFQSTSDTEFYCLGNCNKVTITPKTTNLDHFDSQQGTKTKDATVVTEKTLEIALVMEEMTAKNLALLLLGTVDNTNPQLPVVNLFSQSTISGHLKFYAANDVGPRWYLDIPSITFSPSGGWDVIGDTWGSITATGSVNAVNGAWGTATLAHVVRTVAPENVLIPIIDVGAAGPTQGNTIVGYVGAWIGADSYTYQWKKGGSAISMATTTTYTPVVGDVGGLLTFAVTATNTIGSTTATSDATIAVV